MNKTLLIVADLGLIRAYRETQNRADRQPHRELIEGLIPLLAQRDDRIPLLARGDQASAERLGNAHGTWVPLNDYPRFRLPLITTNRTLIRWLPGNSGRECR
jgi:hypothetical protein